MPEAMNTTIPVFTETGELLRRIADAKRWTLKVAIDEAAKALAEKLNIRSDAPAANGRHGQDAKGSNRSKARQ